jgi:hypothetical protein
VLEAQKEITLMIQRTEAMAYVTYSTQQSQHDTDRKEGSEMELVRNNDIPPLSLPKKAFVPRFK